MKALLLAGVVAIGWTASAIAVPFTLTNGTGEGQVTVGVDGFGSFGRLLSVGSTSSTDAFYRPIGAAAAAGTVYQSGVAIRLDMTGARTFLSTGLGGAGLGAGLSNPAVTGTGLGAQSSFTFNGLTFQLSQSLVSLFQSGVQNGSRLDQTYTITNNGSSAAAFELVRYLDGDLNFNNSIVDGGGLIDGTPRTLFETDTATGSATSATFVGITTTGGTQGNYQISPFSGLRTAVLNGSALTNTVNGDGPDADTFIDAGAGYDVSLALSNLYTLQAGASTTYTTQTLFGTGAPEIFVPPTGVPEPATLALLAAGLVGAGVIRRRRAA